MDTQEDPFCDVFGDTPPSKNRCLQEKYFSDKSNQKLLFDLMQREARNTFNILVSTDHGDNYTDAKIVEGVLLMDNGKK